MDKTTKPAFDQYANKYTEMHKASIAASGEEPSYFSAYKARYMASRNRLAASERPLSILDFGCGVGNSIPHLREAFPHADLHGTDPSSESIALAESSLAAEAEFQVTPDSGLPYPDNSFDAVLVACVLHHIAPSARLRWMRELQRVMKPSGQIFVFEHNMLNPLTVKAVKDCPFDEDAILLPRSELLGLARDAGFTQIGIRYVVFFPHALSMFRSLEPLLGWVPLGAQYVLQASGGSVSN
jgi:ubiquinone/menaquinone biosynthesis C-methylase UbiE